MVDHSEEDFACQRRSESGIGAPSSVTVNIGLQSWKNERSWSSITQEYTNLDKMLGRGNGLYFSCNLLTCFYFHFAANHATVLEEKVEEKAYLVGLQGRQNVST